MESGGDHREGKPANTSKPKKGKGEKADAEHNNAGASASTHANDPFYDMKVIKRKIEKGSAKVIKGGSFQSFGNLSNNVFCQCPKCNNVRTLFFNPEGYREDGLQITYAYPKEDDTLNSGRQRCGGHGQDRLR